LFHPSDPLADFPYYSFLPRALNIGRDHIPGPIPGFPGSARRKFPINRDAVLFRREIPSGYDSRSGSIDE
jgi:hypothetical protein